MAYLSRLAGAVTAAVAGAIASSLFTYLPIQAQEVPAITPATNPAISFRRPLRVSSVRVPNNWELRRSEYVFTFDFPAEAVEPLEKLVFDQIEGVGYPRYQSDDSYAFETDSGERLSLSAVENDQAQRKVTVVFDPPVEPGQQVTVALRARNPRDGLYIYQLTAFPVGASVGQYAGVERLNFYRPSRRDRFNWW
ncbi:MAG: DUF2808 domain-containing protein [Phormidesmis sp.]